MNKPLIFSLLLLCMFRDILNKMVAEKRQAQNANELQRILTEKRCELEYQFDTFIEEVVKEIRNCKEKSLDILVSFSTYC